MKQSEFDHRLANFAGEMSSLLISKGNDYSVNDDRLSNFKEVAKLVSITPMQVWAVFFLKHVTAVMTQAQDGEVKDEPIHMRFIDIANYAFLGDCIVQEEQEQKEDGQRKQEDQKPKDIKLPGYHDRDGNPVKDPTKDPRA